MDSFVQVSVAFARAFVQPGDIDVIAIGRQHQRQIKKSGPLAFDVLRLWLKVVTPGSHIIEQPATAT
jgi:hypothetical protein